MRPELLLWIVLLDVRAGKLSIVGLTVKVGVAKFVLLLLFWGKRNRNGFVKVMAAPWIFNWLIWRWANSRNLYLRLLLRLRSTCCSSLLSARLDYKYISYNTELYSFCCCESENNSVYLLRVVWLMLSLYKSNCFHARKYLNQAGKYLN